MIPGSPTVVRVVRIQKASFSRRGTGSKSQSPRTVLHLQSSDPSHTTTDSKSILLPREVTPVRNRGIIFFFFGGGFEKVSACHQKNLQQKIQKFRIPIILGLPGNILVVKRGLPGTILRKSRPKFNKKKKKKKSLNRTQGRAQGPVQSLPGSSQA